MSSIYDSRQRWKLGFIFAAVLIAMASVVVSDLLIKDQVNGRIPRNLPGSKRLYIRIIRGEILIRGACRMTTCQERQETKYAE